MDTNVPVVANGRSAQASPECVKACVQRLKRLIGSEKLVLDDKWWIIREYMSNLGSSGQPGVGDAFLKWVLTNWGNPRRCEIVKITSVASSGTDFQEFPTDEQLKPFDPSDRKFVAVALVHPSRPPILQAVDPGWWVLRDVLGSHGVRIEFLCSQDISAFAKRKTGR